MKKTLTLVLAMLMMFTFTITAFAEETTTPPPTKDQNAEIKAEIQVLRDQLNSLREQHKTIQAQVVEKKSEMKALLKSAKEASLKEKIAAAKVFVEQLKTISADIKVLREDKTALWVELKAAKSQKDFETVKAKLTQIIEYKKQIIDKANSKLGVMDSIISSLQ